jgi:hypothetical protein
MGLRDDDRGLANRLIIFGGIIIVVALLSATLNPAFSTISNTTDEMADTQEAQEGLSYVEAIWEYKTLVGTMLGVVMLIAGALFESRRGGI